MKLTGFIALLVLLGVVACSAAPLFYESFEDNWVGRWHPSTKEDYQGVWKHEKSEGHENYGLLVSEKARKYGIATLVSEEIEFKDKPIVLQYELRLQNGIECGGSYLKFLTTQPEGWTPEQLDNEAAYSIMFGPDKCGSTNKVHFIFKHKDPKTGEIKEHHLKNPPTPINDKKSHVYTAIIYPNNTVSILIDGELKKSADVLSSDFEPPVLAPKTIPDPEDKKPEDWDERAKIPDPEAKKPEDWDEDAPFEIEDMDATKPEGWLDDEPVDLEDPEAAKPDDWDEEEDGQWEAPKIPNPKCLDAPGCGEWKRPMKRNPDYKGKWFAPLIENPAYKGIWKPRDIPNPDYVHLDKPDLQPVSAIAIEIWTMQDGILFDNVLITDDQEVAEEYRVNEWKVKFDAENTQEKKEEAEEAAKTNLFSKVKESVFKVLYQVADLPQLASYRDKLVEIIEKGEEKPELTLGVIGGAALLLLVVIFRLLFGGKISTKPSKKSTGKAKKEDITPADDATGTEKVNNKGKEKEGEASEAEGPRQRKPRRET